METHGLSCNFERVATLASVSLASIGSSILDDVVGPPAAVAAQIELKAKVVQAMHESVQLCQDPQTEFVLARESLGVGRMNPAAAFQAAQP